MLFAQFNGVTLAAIIVPIAVAWGFACGAFERFLLAPGRRLSWAGPAYLPGMIFGFFAGCCFLIGEDEVRLLFALLMAAVFYLVGALPAVLAFHVTRRVFRTQFCIKTRT